MGGEEVVVGVVGGGPDMRTTVKGVYDAAGPVSFRVRGYLCLLPSVGGRVTSGIRRAVDGRVRVTGVAKSFLKDCAYACLGGGLRVRSRDVLRTVMRRNYGIVLPLGFLNESVKGCLLIGLRRGSVRRRIDNVVCSSRQRVERATRGALRGRLLSGPRRFRG